MQYDPLLLESRILLSKIFEAEGNIKEAERFLKENLEILPGHQKSILDLMTMYFRANQESEALGLGQKILIQNKDERLLTDLASMFAALGHRKIASSLYHKALEVNPHFKEAYLNLGKLYGNDEEWDTTTTIWQKGWSLDKKDKRFVDLINQAELLKGASEKK